MNRLLVESLGQTQRAKKSRPKWFDIAKKTAEREHVLGVRVTRVDQNLVAKRASVESLFLARMPDGSWETVWKHSETVDASKKNPELEARIKEDSQVRKVLDAAKLFGLGGDEEPLRMALRFGAATMQAQESVDARFFEFRDRYLRRLDGPPIYWPNPR